MKSSRNGGDPVPIHLFISIPTCSECERSKRGQKKSLAPRPTCDEPESETRTGKDRDEGKIGERHSQEEPAGGRRGGNDVPCILVCIPTQRINQVRTATASASEALPGHTGREVFGSKRQQAPLAGGIRACDVVKS